jgi:hypothetical protein
MNGATLFHQLSQSGIPVEPVGDGDSLATRCSSLRINIAGNKIGTLVTPKGMTPLERTFRRFPVDGTLTATPESPFIFELGAIDVPKQMALVLLDVRWAIYVPSGIAVGDTRELADRRLSTVLGYDMRFTDTRTADISYQLEPSFPTPATQTFAQASNAGIIPGNGISGVAQSTFDQIRAAQVGSSSYAGASTLPQRHRRDSQLDMPFTYLVTENKRINFNVIVFRPIPIPVSFFEVEAAGLIIGQNAIQDFVDSVKPCVSKGSV